MGSSLICWSAEYRVWAGQGGQVAGHGVNRLAADAANNVFPLLLSADKSGEPQLLDMERNRRIEFFGAHDVAADVSNRCTPYLVHLSSLTNDNRATALA